MALRGGAWGWSRFVSAAAACAATLLTTVGVRAEPYELFARYRSLDPSKTEVFEVPLEAHDVLPRESATYVLEGVFFRTKDDSFSSASTVQMRNFVAGLGVGVSNLLFDANGQLHNGLPREAVLGAKYGLAGAYIYALLYLGKRTFRSDITPGAANWVAVTMAAGPVLAGAVATFLRTKDAADVPLSYQSVLFFSGFAPRVVAEYVEGVVRRNYFGQGARPTSGRVVALTDVRGVGLEVHERLAEEGIDDATALAMADPLRLLRNTSFDKRQIVGWIDNAILVTTLPEGWRALEAQGISGAIDLAWYCDPDEPPTANPAQDRPVGAAITRLADAARMDAGVLRDVCQRLWQDSQVRLLWVLYQLEYDEVTTPAASA